MLRNIGVERIRLRQAGLAARIRHASAEEKCATLSLQISRIYKFMYHPPRSWSKARIRSFVENSMQVAVACGNVDPSLDEAFERVFKKACAKFSKPRSKMIGVKSAPVLAQAS